jgi:hypothetical protein
MRADVTNTTVNSRPRRKARHVVLALAVCSLAIPATANAEPISSPHFATPDSDYSSVNSIAPPADSEGGSSGSVDVDPGYSSLNAISGPQADAPTFASSSPTGSGDGFDWPSALVGAGAALALAALCGAAMLTIRRRTTVAPSPSTS